MPRRDGNGVRAGIALAVAMAAAGAAPAQNALGDLFGLGRGGEKRVARESLVRAPDGTWAVESPAGLQPHACQPAFAAAEDLFRTEKYGSAATAFRRVGRKYPGTAVEEECLFMEAECLYKAGKLPTACEVYHKLLKDYPATRHLPQAVQKTYDIAAEWLEDSRLRNRGKPPKFSTWARVMNFSDPRRPFTDLDGHAIEAIEHIKEFDPNGPLTAQAIMMAGEQKAESQDFIKAATYFEQVVTEHGRSEEAARAAYHGAQAYMQSYQGVQYDGQDLDNAHKMTVIALSRSSQLKPKEVEELKNNKKALELEKARRDFESGRVYARLMKWEAAKFYYEMVIRQHAETQYADRAREELARIAPRLTSSTAAAPPAKKPSDTPRKFAAPPEKGGNNDAIELEPAGTKRRG